MTDHDAAAQPTPDHLVGAVVAMHGPHLDEAQRARLRERAERLRRQIATLALYHLENQDEPAASFGATPGSDRQ